MLVSLLLLGSIAARLGLQAAGAHGGVDRALDTRQVQDTAELKAAINNTVAGHTTPPPTPPPAFAEARGGQSGSCSDHGDVKIVVRTSADSSGRNGTWGPIVVVANETGHTIGNPSPVVENDASQHRGMLLQVDAFVAWSDDEGATWSPRVALDGAVKVPGSGWYGAGVGGGVQFKLNATHSRLTILSEERVGPAYNSVPVYSDDSGVSWARLPFLNCPSNHSHGLGEPSVDALPTASASAPASADLIMSGRGASAPFVSFSRSRDGGATWTPSVVLAIISSPGCQAPIVAAHDGSFAVITSPTGPGRANLGAYRATAAAGFGDWAAAGGVLAGGVAGYSSLLRAEKAGEFLVAYETSKSPTWGHSDIGVTLLRFTL